MSYVCHLRGLVLGERAAAVYILQVRELETEQTRHPLHASRVEPARARGVLAWIAPLLAALLVVSAWQLFDLRALGSPEHVAQAVRALREQPVGFAYVLLVFALGSLLFVPITALVLGVIVAFGPVRGFFYAWLGVLLAASLTYGAGRLLGSYAFMRLRGRRLTKLGEQLHANAFRASVMVRLMPVGNFTAVNLFAGTLRVPFHRYFLGNLVGSVPGTLCAVLFAEQLARAAQSPDPQSIALLVGGAVLSIGALLLLRRATKR